MQYLATTTRRLVRPNMALPRNMTAPHSRMSYRLHGGAGNEGQKLRRTNSQGMALPVRDGEIDSDGRAMLERTLTRPNTGRPDKCTDGECKWICKQNKMGHYHPYPIDTYQDKVMCPNSWNRASLNFSGVGWMLAFPAVLGMGTEYRCKDYRHAIDDVMFKGFRDKETDTSIDPKKKRGYSGYFNLLAAPDTTIFFAEGGSGPTFTQWPEGDGHAGSLAEEGAKALRADARYKYHRVA